MIQPDWKAIIDDMPPEQQAEVRRIADKMTKYFMTDRLIFEDYPAPPRKPGEPIKFREFRKEVL